VAAAVVLVAAGLPLLGEAAPVTSADGRWRVVDRLESAYGEIKVVDDERSRERVCLLDGSSQSWVWLVEPPVSLFTYTEVLEDQLAALAAKGGRALVIGLGGGLLPAALERRGVAVDVVEINPQMVEVAESWFGFEPAKYEVHVTDGRIFVMEAATATYDLVILDVAGGGSQPWHLFSVEAFADLARTLKPGGILVVNLLGFVGDDRSQIATAVTASVARVLPAVAAWSVSARSAAAMTNILVYASAGELPAAIARAAEGRGLQPFPLPDAAAQVLTDDHNPLDLWSPAVNLAWRRSMVAWLGEEVLSR
jgi:spermidine synthase